MPRKSKCKVRSKSKTKSFAFYVNSLKKFFKKSKKRNLKIKKFKKK